MHRDGGCPTSSHSSTCCSGPPERSARPTGREPATTEPPAATRDPAHRPCHRRTSDDRPAGNDHRRARAGVAPRDAHRNRARGGVPGDHRGAGSAPQRLHHGAVRRRAAAGAQPGRGAGARRRPRAAARHPHLPEGHRRSGGGADHRRLPAADGTSRGGGRAGRGAPASRRRHRHRQVQPPRVRVRHHRRGVGLRSDPQSPCAGAHPGRVEQRLGGLRRHGDGAGLDRHRYGGLHSHPRVGLRRGRG